MLFKSSAITGLFAAFAAGSIIPRTIVGSGGTIVSPASFSDAPAGHSIPFRYITFTNTNSRCHSGYTPIEVYLLDAPPTNSDVTDSGEFTNFIHHFGRFLIPIPGLPPMVDPPPPPSTLTIPDLGPSVHDGELFFSIIETIDGCVPDSHLEYGLSSTPIEYHAV
ncbi:hypothetical protein QCA50_001357 [Cerrena zonata]|uniref:Uncharacterized protein n=1 Tax=Cerrena zonata TaxID=2478898 RepID=A0AAW0GNE7_9APHY